MIRVANFAQFQLQMSQILRTQSSVAESQIEIATGKKAQSYSEISSQSNQLVNLERSVTRKDQFITNIEQAEIRLNTMESSLNVMVDRAIEVKSIISQGLSGSNINDLPLVEFARTFSTEIAALLNTQLAGEYVFSGSLTDQVRLTLRTQPICRRRVCPAPLQRTRTTTRETVSSAPFGPMTLMTLISELPRTSPHSKNCFGPWHTWITPA